MYYFLLMVVIFLLHSHSFTCYLFSLISILSFPTFLFFHVFPLLLLLYDVQYFDVCLMNSNIISKVVTIEWSSSSLRILVSLIHSPKLCTWVQWSETSLYPCILSRELRVKTMNSMGWIVKGMNYQSWVSAIFLWETLFFSSIFMYSFQYFYFTMFNTLKYIQLI